MIKLTNGNSTFAVAKGLFLNSLKHLQKIEKSGGKKESSLEITIYDEYLLLVIPGIQLKVQAITEGSAKFAIGLWYMTSVMSYIL